MALEIMKLLKLANGGEVSQAGTPLGGNVVTPEIDQMIARGMGRFITCGAFSTPLAGGGAAAIFDLDRPRVAVGVPSGYTIRPLLVSVQVQSGAPADAEEVEALVGVDVYGLWTGDGAHTDITAYNMRTDLGAGSACRIGDTFTGDMTTTPQGGTGADPVVSVELARQVIEYAVGAAGEIEAALNLVYQPRYPLFITGPATLLVYYGGDTAIVGAFTQMAWIEGRSDEFFVRT